MTALEGGSKKTDCGQPGTTMEFGNPKLSSGPFENQKGPGCDNDNSELSFRVPSIPSSASITTAPVQPESENQKGHDLNGSSYGR